MTTVAPAVTPARLPASRASRPAAVALALLGLLAVYALLSLFNDPRGTLGTDTGGKLATVVTMDRHGTWDPDVGYWAERFDPNGDLHPLYYTSHVGDRWVNLTTLPMVLAARPLYALGGARAILLLPMLGAAFAALGARALARRIGGDDGWWAFWVVGLASPVAIYALDFWEHAPGIAFAMWGVVFMYDVLDRRAGWRAAAVSGACFGAAATMRTEALVYALVLAVVAAVVLAHRTFVQRTVGFARDVQWGSAWAVGLGLPLLCNQWLERTILGETIRAGRAAGTARMAGDGGSLRAREALITAVGLNRFEFRADWVFGALAVALVAYAALRLASTDRQAQQMGVVALAAAGFVYVVRFTGDLGFVPGMLSASPLAAVGLAIGWSVRRWRLVGIVAVVAVPLVWMFQFTGGASPQWGGRYLLVSSTLLVVGAAVVLPAMPRAARAGLVVLAALVTIAGVGWLHQRSHAVAAAAARLPTGSDTVVVSREAHLLRESGAFYDPDAQWLTAETADELDRAAEIAAAVDAGHLDVVYVRGRGVPRRLGQYVEQRRQMVEFLPGLRVVIARYDVAGG